MSPTPQTEGRTDGRLRVVTLLDEIGAGGGAEKLAREILIRLDPDRFERTLCISRWTPEEAGASAAQAPLDELREAGVRFLGLDRDSARQLRPWRPLVSLLRRERIDVLHAHKFGPNVWAAVIGTIARTPVVIAHEHTWSFEGQPLRRFLDRNLIARQANAFLAVSREDRRRMIEVEGIDPAKLLVMPNGISPPPAPTGRDVRSELGIAPEAPVVGTVCTLRAQKALNVLVEAAALLAREVPGVRVVIVGGSQAGGASQRGRLEELIARLDLAETVIMTGHRADVPDLIGSFDVAVCSSDFEGTPLSILEYMEHGLPVVSTRVGGIPDMIEDGVHGLLVPRRDPAALAAALGRLLADRPLAAEMGSRGRERRRSEFDIAVTVRRVERLYEELCAAGGRLDQVDAELLAASGTSR